jgi:hypothetical protein
MSSEENKNSQPDGQEVNTRPKLEITYVPIKDLKLAPYNPKGFNSKQFQRLGMSVDNFGLIAPLIVNKRTGHTVDGNQRLKDAIQDGDLEKTLPVVYIDVDETQEKKITVALNKTSTPEDPEKMMELLKQFSEDNLMKEMMKDYDKTLKEYNKSVELSEYEISKDVDEKYNYVVFVFDKGLDFSNIETFFGLQSVFDPRKNRVIGLGRVIDGNKLLELINTSNKSNQKPNDTQPNKS